jgi:hypothetical protein
MNSDITEVPRVAEDCAANNIANTATSSQQQSLSNDLTALHCCDPDRDPIATSSPTLSDGGSSVVSSELVPPSSPLSTSVSNGPRIYTDLQIAQSIAENNRKRKSLMEELSTEDILKRPRYLPTDTIVPPNQYPLAVAKASANRSWVWNHFKKIIIPLGAGSAETVVWADCHASCNICHRKATLDPTVKWSVAYTSSHNPGHLERHVRQYHSEILAEKNKPPAPTITATLAAKGTSTGTAAAATATNTAAAATATNTAAAATATAAAAATYTAAAATAAATAATSMEGATVTSGAAVTATAAAAAFRVADVPTAGLAVPASSASASESAMSGAAAATRAGVRAALVTGSGTTGDPAVAADEGVGTRAVSMTVAHADVDVGEEEEEDEREVVEERGREEWIIGNDRKEGEKRGEQEGEQEGEDEDEDEVNGGEEEEREVEEDDEEDEASILSPGESECQLWRARDCDYSDDGEESEEENEEENQMEEEDEDLGEEVEEEEEIEMSRNKSTLKEFQKISESFLKWAVATYLPLDTVESSSFREMCLSLNPECPMIAKKDIIGTLKGVERTVGVLLKRTLKDKKVAITIEHFTSVENLDYVVHRAHYVSDKWNLISITLDCTISPPLTSAGYRASKVTNNVVLNSNSKIHFQMFYVRYHMSHVTEAT